MITYLVLWLVVTMHPVSCLQPEPYTDKFGIRHGINQMTLQVCLETVKKPMQKYFDTRAEAEEFIKEGKKYSDGNWQSSLEGFEILEVDKKISGEIK